jgi:transposase InsO family protein
LNDEGERRLNVSGVLRVLGVSRNGYYSFRKRLPSDRQKRKEAIMEKIMAIYNESHQNYGAPKITMVLQSEGEKISEKTVGNYMRELGIRAQYVKPYTVTTIDSDFSIELKNILDEEFNPSEPNAVWCSDITYIWTYEGFVYLTSIMDLFSRKIIAWELSTTLEAKWVVETINRAKKARRIDKPLVMHSDRGIQYTCSAYMEATEGYINSYSKKAFPWDNACIESFHALIKREWLNRFKILDHNHAYRLVFEYIEAFYNTVRIHSHCGYLSPNQYEVNYAKQLVKLYNKVS